MASSDRRSRIEAIARSHVDKGRFSGIEWLVLRDGETWARGRAGWSDALNGVELPQAPIYRAFSMTKPVVSAVAMMLMEQGRLRLYEPIAAYLPEFAEMQLLDPQGKLVAARNPIVVEHLLTHKAGLSYGFLPDCPIAPLYRRENLTEAKGSLAEVIGRLAALPLAFEPGSAWRYSMATDVLARLLEVVLARPLPEILDELVLSPLGMTDTGFKVPVEQRSRIMAMFGTSDLDRMFEPADGPQTLVPADISHIYPADDDGFYRGGHGLFTTLDDYALFAAFLASGKAPGGERLLSRKALELMWANRIPRDQLPLTIGPVVLPGYGFSLCGRVMLDLGQAMGFSSLGECGWAGAASTYFWIDNAERMIGIVMSQYLGSMVPLQDDIRNAVYQALDD